MLAREANLRSPNEAVAQLNWAHQGRPTTTFYAFASSVGSGTTGFGDLGVTHFVTDRPIDPGFVGVVVLQSFDPNKGITPQYSTELVIPRSMRLPSLTTLEFTHAQFILPLASATFRSDATDTLRPSSQEMARNRDDMQTHEARLRAAIHEVFPCAQLSAGTHADPEENWEKPVLLVSTAIDDFDERFALEQKFYLAVQRDPELATALRRIGVIFE
jgi:hypothetical protein